MHMDEAARIVNLERSLRAMLTIVHDYTNPQVRYLFAAEIFIAAELVNGEPEEVHVSTDC